MEPEIPAEEIEQLPNEGEDEKDLLLPPPKVHYLVGLAPPILKPPVDSYGEELKYLKPLEVGGLLGRSLINLNKPAIVRDEQNIFGEIENFTSKDMKVDGIYTKGAQEITYNMQKLEQRLLRLKELGYFNRSNWQLRLDSDVTTHFLSKPVDVSLEPNPNIYLKNISAMYSNRINASKTKYYRLDLHLGLVSFRDHALFCEEDYLANQVKYLYYQYEKRVSLCLIDHLESRLVSLGEELNEKQYLFKNSAYAASSLEQERNKMIVEELELLQENISDTEIKIEQERKMLQEMAERLYGKWLDLKTVRDKQHFASTSVKIGVKQIIENGRSPEYDFYLQAENPTDTVPSNENSRRLLIQSTRIFIRIIVNGVYVTRTTKRFLLWPSFDVFFGERFELHLFTRPVKVRLEVCTGLRWTRTLAVLEFTPPGLNVIALSSSGNLYKDLEFIAANPLKERFTDAAERKVTGNITLKAGWMGHSDKMPPIRFEDLGLIPRRFAELPSELEAFIDVNDPRNKELLLYLQIKRDQQIHHLLEQDSLFSHHRFTSYRYLIYKERYNYNSLVDLLVPMLERDIIASPLLKRILDAIKIDGFAKEKINYFYVQDLKMQSLIESPGIKRMKSLMDHFRIKQNRVRLGFEQDKTSLENVVREFIMIENKFLLQCCKFIFAPRRRLLPRKKKVQKVAVSTLGSCKISIMIYKAFNVPIRAAGIESHKKYIQDDIINKQRKGYSVGPQMGYNQSARSQGNSYPQGFGFNNSMPMPNQPMMEDNSRGIGFRANEIDEDRVIRYGLVERVQSFVEISLTHNDKVDIVRTIPFDGAMPEWNELLEITFESLNKKEFTISELLDCESILYFSLYDQVLFTSNSVHVNEYNVKLEKRFLSGFELPLQTILQNPAGIEASFRMHRPLLLQGYRIQRSDPFKAKDDTEVFNDPEKPTYLSVKINLDPVLELPVDNDAEYYTGFETPTFLFHGSNWLSAIKNKKSVLKDRRIQLWAENAYGQSVFLPRFIAPLEPPEGLISRDDQDPIAKIARYVSLIPHIEDAKAFKDLPDIWSSCQELFDLTFGDYEEHAILLCNYFKWIDRANPAIKSYILIGNGVPEGKSIYVLRRDSAKGDLELWNASTGVGYSICQSAFSANFFCINISRGTKNQVTDKEYTIGLKSVGCAIDENDVYLNIQKYSDPYVIDFNIDNLKSWLPFLGKSTRRTNFFPNNIVTTIQHPIEYEHTPEEFLYHKQVEIEDYLRNRFQELKIKTDYRGVQWAGPSLTNKIYEIFPLLETFHSSFRSGASESSLYHYPRENANNMLNEIEQRIIGILSPNSFGITINSPLDKPENLWEKIKHSDIHNIGYDNCTFLLAVRIMPYPGFVCSVWVYIGVIFGENQYNRTS